MLYCAREQLTDTTAQEREEERGVAVGVVWDMGKELKASDDWDDVSGTIRHSFC